MINGMSVTYLLVLYVVDPFNSILKHILRPFVLLYPLASFHKTLDALMFTRSPYGNVI